MGNTRERERTDTKRKAERRQSGLRIPEDTLTEVAVAAARSRVPRWKKVDELLRRGLGLPPRD